MKLQSRGAAAGDDEIGTRIRALAPWFHNLHLPSGHQTAPDHPLGDFPAFKWEQIGPVLGEDLSGLEVLDIGCNAGFYSVAMVRRGARVLGIDVDPHYLRQAAWAREQFGIDPERLELRQMEIYELANLERTFDVVLFLGVLYHLRYPLLALDVVASKVGERLVLQTLSLPGEEVAEVPPDLHIDERAAMLAPGWPKMAFIEHSLAGDPTNWWAPNRACVEAMLRSAGLAPEGTPGHEITVARRVREAQPPGELRAIFPRCQPLGLTDRR
jgi:tRNA (mo5U34)-methyltransferase